MRDMTRQAPISLTPLQIERVRYEATNQSGFTGTALPLVRQP